MIYSLFCLGKIRRATALEKKRMIRQQSPGRHWVCVSSERFPRRLRKLCRLLSSSAIRRVSILRRIMQWSIPGSSGLGWWGMVPPLGNFRFRKYCSYTRAVQASQKHPPCFPSIVRSYIQSDLSARPSSTTELTSKIHTFRKSLLQEFLAFHWCLPQLCVSCEDMISNHKVHFRRP